MFGTHLVKRVVEPEVMDDPDLDRDRHNAALSSLARINWLSASSRLVWRPIRELAKRLANPLDSVPLRVLDIATGSGDLPVELWKRAKRCGVSLEIVGVDISETALELARKRVRDDAPIEFRILNAVADELPTDFDVITCSLFLHHLSDAEAELLLEKMTRCAKHLVVVNDLRRCRRGWWLALIASRLLSTSDVVHTDACLSVQAAFSVNEVRDMAERLHLSGVTVRQRWPFRYVLTAESNA